MSWFHTLLARMVSEPWLLEARRMGQLEGLAARAMAGAEISPDAFLAAAGVRPRGVLAVAAGMDAEQIKLPVGRGYARVGGVAVVNITGPLDKTDEDVTWWGMMHGTSYQGIDAALAAIAADDRVRATLLRIDSPGGAATAIEVAGDAVFSAAERGRNGGKPVYAFADDVMASAALYLGVQAHKVYVTPSAWVGSIGTRMMTIDISSYLEREGVRVNILKSGEFKDMGSPFRPMTDRDRAKFMENLAVYFNAFKAAVAKGRRMEMSRVDTLATGEGWIGAQAVAVGLADGVRPSLAALVAELNDAHSSKGTTGRAAHSTGSTMMSARNSSDGSDAAAGSGGDAGQKKPEKPEDKKEEVIGTIPPTSPAAGNTVDVSAAVNAALAGEQTRVSSLKAAAQPFLHLEGVSAACDKAILAGPTAPEGKLAAFQAVLLPMVAGAMKPVGSIDLSVGASGWEREKQAHSVVLMARMRPDLEHRLQWGSDRDKAQAERAVKAMGFTSGADYLKQLGEARSNAAGHGGMNVGRMRLLNVAERFAVAGLGGGGFGARPRSFDNDNRVVEAAFGHGSSDFPILTANVANKTLLGYFAETPVIFDRIARIGSSTDFKTSDLITMSKLPSLLLTPEGAPLKEATFSERKEQIRVYTYGRKFSITRELIVNDDLSGIQQTLQTWGIVARRVPDILAITILTANAAMSDGVALFHADHKNLLTGAALSVAALEAAVTKMKRQVSFGAEAVPIQVDPRTLLVPSELWGTSERITKSVTDPVIGNDTINVMRGLVEPINTNLLSDPAAWYVFADTAMVPALQVNFLNGNQSPIVTQVGNGSIRGMEYEIIHDCGAKSVNFEGVYKNPGP